MSFIIMDIMIATGKKIQHELTGIKKKLQKYISMEIDESKIEKSN